MRNVSAIVLTLNEERLITRCLDSISDLVNEIVVVDSGSTDGTRKLAQLYPAVTWIDQPWLGWTAQRQVGIAAATNHWVFVLEADEYPDARMREALRTADLSVPSVAYSVDRRGDWLGVLLPNDQRRRNRLSFIRLFHRDVYSYDPSAVVHERVLVPSEASRPLAGVLVHWRGARLNDYQGMIDKYSTIEAEVLATAGREAGAAHLICRPILRFAWTYIARGNWRLGIHGLTHSIHKAYAEYLRWAKLWEAQVERPAATSSTSHADLPTAQ